MNKHYMNSVFGRLKTLSLLFLSCLFFHSSGNAQASCDITIFNLGDFGYLCTNPLVGETNSLTQSSPFAVPCDYCSSATTFVSYGSPVGGCDPANNSTERLFFVYGANQSFNPCAGEGILVTDENGDGVANAADFDHFYNGDGCSPVYITWAQVIETSEEGCPCDGNCISSSLVSAQLYPVGYEGVISVPVDGDCETIPRVEVYAVVNGVQADTPCEIEYLTPLVDMPECGTGVVNLTVRVVDTELQAGAPATDNCNTLDVEVPFDCDCCSLLLEKEIAGDTSVCAAAELTFSVVDPIAGNNYDWSLDDPAVGTISGNGTPDITITLAEDLPNAGPYTLTVLETNDINCMVTYSIDFTVEIDGGLVCNDELNISLDETCEFLFLPDWGLENQLYPDDSYTIVITDEDGNIVPDNIVTEKGNYSFSIEHNCSGNSCWGVFVAEDKLLPTITCPPDPEIDFICTDVDELFNPVHTVIFDNINGADFSETLVTGNPEATDNCDMFTISYHDALADGGDCGDDIITRTFFVHDMSGNSGETCTQEIIIRKPILADVTFPENILLECGELADVSPDAISDAGYDNAFPTVTSYFGTHDINETYCNLGASYNDSPPVDLCGGGFKIIRVWSVLDWCSSETITYSQVIKVEDTIAPVITCPSYEDISADNSADSCEGSLLLAGLENVVENCSNPVTVTIEIIDEDGNSLGSGYAVGDEVVLNAGIYNIIYTAADACGNISEPCSTTVTVGDETSPVAICDEHTVVSLGIDGTAEICWETFDDGSYDNCSEITIRVKRMDAPSSQQFSECIAFDCNDIGSTILVRMRVWDVLPSNGFPDNDAGRWNECMIEVEVQDKIAPAIVCPPDKTVECQSDVSTLLDVETTNGGNFPEVYYNGELIGYYSGAADNCEATVTITDSGELDSCGEGIITRTWTAEDGGGRTSQCVQTISVINSDPFSASDIDWPADYTSDCITGQGLQPDELPDGVNYPVVTEDNCDLVAVTFEDTVLPVTPDACWKIVREWTVIDWCQFEVNANGSYEGHWVYSQVIKVHDAVEPVIVSTCEDLSFCNYNEDCAPAYAELILEAEDACSEDLVYSYVIDAFADGVLDGIEGESNDASGNYPNGTHHITWTVEDGCGNITTCDYNFTIADCKQPSPICINGLATVIMPSSGEVTLWDTDFDAPGTSGSFDNCTAQEDLRFRIRKVEEGQFPLTTLSEVLALGHDVVFTCADLGFRNVELYVIDEAGNWDFCTTYAAIQNNDGPCTGSEYASITGYIETEYQEMIEDVAVAVTGSNAVPPFLTQADGSFNFSSVALNSNITITPEKNVDFLNGVTTFDLVLISKHILGITPFDSPYKIIAGDANRSGSVTTLDLVLLRRLILNIDNELAGNTSWRFIDKDFNFPDASNPFATTFPEVIAYNNFDANDFAADFVGVKIGDVNGSAVPNNLLGVQERSFSGVQAFVVEDVEMKAGEVYTVAFKANDFKAMSGYQFTLNFDTDALAFENIETTNLKNLDANNFGLTNVAAGLITTSWHDAKAVTLQDGETVFAVSFEAKVSTLLSKVLGLNSKLTVAEAYTDAGELQDVAIAYNRAAGVEVAGTGFSLYQNQPNPFDVSTTISFELPETSNATLTVFDVSGKILKVVNKQFTKGLNQVKLERSELSGAGVLYYQLDTDKHSATKKMILLH